MHRRIQSEDWEKAQFLRGMYCKEAEMSSREGARDCCEGSRQRNISLQVKGAFKYSDKVADCIWPQIEGGLIIAFPKSSERYQGIPAHWYVVFTAIETSTDHYQVTPDIEISPVPPVSVPEDGAVNSVEERLLTIEAGFNKLVTAIETLGEECEALRQKVVLPSQHPTFLVPRGPSPSRIQTPTSKPSSGQQRPIPPATLSSTDPFSYAAATPVQADAAGPSGVDDDAMDFGVGPIAPETGRYRMKNINTMKFA
ncbi:hypothetical protein BDR06DRAFT_978163 [Suillus hirtellus]|nr:hypothetical protein BDR06DRAFT_978163 [Suillus hirtellus]